VVAIPTLIAHGFLAQRIQWNLSLLERYALEFVTAQKRPGRPRIDQLMKPLVEFVERGDP